MKNKVFLAAMYLRLSREDKGNGYKGNDYKGKSEAYAATESNSIINQRELIRDYIRRQDDIELYDIYVDDGFSGSNFDRPEFKRMLKDIETGSVNCVIVKDLSRFGRDYIESGRYIQKVFPKIGVRFIAITDNYDSIHADVGESSIVLPVKNFINDSYCRDISTKVKSQLEIKRKKGECTAPFVLYGYQRSMTEKNKLVIDEYAAQVVRQIFEWKIQGMAVSAIAGKLNEFGILSPREYKKSNGINYNGGFYGSIQSKWSSSTVKRILTDETYLGHLIQGKTQKINYKLKKIVEKPESEWVRAENTHEAIVGENEFKIVQSLLKSVGRGSSVSEKINIFSGILCCGDCGGQLIRRENRYKTNVRVYYICALKNRGQGCTRHSIEEETLKELVKTVMQKYADLLCDRLQEETDLLCTGLCVTSHLSCEELQARPYISYGACYQKEEHRLKREIDRYEALSFGLYEDLKKGIIDEEEFVRLRQEFRRRTKEYDEAQKNYMRLKEELRLKAGDIIYTKTGGGTDDEVETEVEKKPETMRYALCIMINKINVYEDKRVEIEFSFTDPYKHRKESDLSWGM